MVGRRRFTEVAAQGRRSPLVCLLALGVASCHGVEPVAPVVAAAAPTSSGVLAPPKGSARAAAPSVEDDAGPGAASDISCGDVPPLVTTERLGDGGVDAGAGAEEAWPFSFYRVRRAPPVASTSSAVRLVLHGPSTARVGRPFALHATLENAGDALVLGLPVDGSAEHWRSPYLDVYAATADGRVYRYDSVGGRCGMVGARSTQDFAKVRAASRVADPFGEWASHLGAVRVEKEGRAKMWLVYTSCEGPDLGAAFQLARRTPLPKPWLGTLVSDSITIEVRARP